jgi:hypothetical protein
MATPVEAALLQIVRSYSPVAPNLTPEQVRAELEPYLEGLFYDGEEDVDVLAVAGLARLRRRRSAGQRAESRIENRPNAPLRWRVS